MEFDEEGFGCLIMALLAGFAFLFLFAGFVTSITWGLVTLGIIVAVAVSLYLLNRYT